AIAVTRAGRISTTHHSARAAAAWRCEAVKAGPVIERQGDIAATSRRLLARSGSRSPTMPRSWHAPRPLAKVEAGMAWAQRTGMLHEFNQEYRRRRLEAQGKDQRFMGYGQARVRLQRAITKVAATGAVPAAIVRRPESAYS